MKRCVTMPMAIALCLSVPQVVEAGHGLSIAQPACPDGASQGSILDRIRAQQELRACLEARLKRVASFRSHAETANELRKRIRKVDERIDLLKRKKALRDSHFGTGVAFQRPMGRTHYSVESAILEDAKVVRVTGYQEQNVALSMDVHRFIWFDHDTDLGIGPFLMANAKISSGVQITRAGAGIMVGFRHFGETTNAKLASLNLGIAIAWDNGTKRLAKGFVDGELAPKTHMGTFRHPVLSTGSPALVVVLSLTPRIQDPAP